MIHALPLADYHVGILQYKRSTRNKIRYRKKIIITTPMILSLYTSALKYNIII